MLETYMEIIYNLEAFKNWKSKFLVVDAVKKGWGEKSS